MYKICNKLLSFNFIDNDYFEKIFKKYELIVENEADIHISSIVVETFPFGVDEVIISSQLHQVIKYEGCKYYIFLNDGVSHAAVKLDDEEGNYNCYLLNDKNAYYYEYILLQCAISSYFSYHNNAVFIHSSCIEYKNSAIMFSALSGTGKSTQARLWKEYKGAKHINDDKNLIFLEDDKLVVYGTPLSGKHHLDENTKGYLKSIIFIKQSPTNSIKKLSKMEAYIQLLNQIQRPNDQYDDQKMNFMINKILELPFYELSCNISEEAVDTVYNELFLEE